MEACFCPTGIEKGKGHCDFKKKKKKKKDDFYSRATEFTSHKNPIYKKSSEMHHINVNFQSKKMVEMRLEKEEKKVRISELQKS